MSILSSISLALTIIHIGASASTRSEALPNTSSGADAPVFSNTQQSETTQILDDSTSSSTRIENTDKNELSITDPSLMGLSQEMTSKSTADASVGDKQPGNLSHLEPVSSYQQKDPQQQTSISGPGIQQLQEQGQIVKNGVDDLLIAIEAQGSVKQHSIASSQIGKPGASQPERILQQQKEQQQVGGASQLLQTSQQLQQQTVQGVQQQQQPQQQTRPMVIWNGIMEFVGLLM